MQESLLAAVLSIQSQNKEIGISISQEDQRLFHQPGPQPDLDLHVKEASCSGGRLN